MFDVLVIGGGMAGVVAALTARRAGAKVALASRSWGATALSTGAVDLAYSPALSPTVQSPRTLAEHLMDIVAHRTRHPYAVIGLETTIRGLREGYGVLRDVLGDGDLALPPLDLEAENRLVPSTLGALLPAASAYAPHGGYELGARTKAVGVLQLLGDGHFAAERLVAGWRHDAQALLGSTPTFEIITARLPVLPPVAMARRLDDSEQVMLLAEQLRRKGEGLDAIIAPPVLGFDRAGAVRARLSEAAGCPVVEALAHLPSVPGMRLQRRLDAAVANAGIERVGAIAAPLLAGAELQGGTTDDGLAIRAGGVVLASGRFIAGGVTWEGRCREALFGLPVESEVGLVEDDSPQAVVRELPVESHPLMTAGVSVNERLQPLREGRVAHRNLFAAGMVVGGFASRYVLCADGVALASGWHAGRAAAGRTS